MSQSRKMGFATSSDMRPIWSLYPTHQMMRFMESIDLSSDSDDCFGHSGACAAETRNLAAITSGFRVRAKWRAPE
jgi:hypothetical protein